MNAFGKASTASMWKWINKLQQTNLITKDLSNKPAAVQITLAPVPTETNNLFYDFTIIFNTMNLTLLLVIVKKEKIII